MGLIGVTIERMPLVEQELLTLTEYMSSPPVFSAVRVTRSLAADHQGLTFFFSVMKLKDFSM
jgi:hypothetical protein